MDTNHVPKLDMKTSTTGCCPKFDPAPWDDKTFTFKDKLFVKVPTRSFFFMPLNLGKVISKTWAAIEEAGAKDGDEFILLSKDVSPWRAEQYFWVSKEVPGFENIKLTGKFKAKVFEGPYKDAKNWHNEMAKLAKDAGAKETDIYLYYTTCPKCAKVYGKNYVVGFAKLD